MKRRLGPCPATVVGVSGSARDLRSTYETVTAEAGGDWHSLVTIAGRGTVIERDADYVIEGASVQKLAIALAVLDKVDRGELALSDRLELTPDVVAPGTGVYGVQAAYGDELTLANILVAMLQASDNTAVRMFGLVVPGPEINDILAAKGFTYTRVEPLPDNPNRFFLGTTTPRETHTLLTGLADQTLLSAGSTRAMLSALRRSEGGYCDGVRRAMSSAERARVATKHGADSDRRHEAGVILDATGAPVLTFAYFADNLDDIDNYGATHPAVEAHAALGRTMYDTA